jgi:hypothetical protein
VDFGACALRIRCWAGEPAAVPSATSQQIQQTVERAITYLQTESADWLKSRKCAACHRELEAPDADQLRRQLLGHARPVATGAQEELKRTGGVMEREAPRPARRVFACAWHATNHPATGAASPA